MIGLFLSVLALTVLVSWRLRTMTVWVYPSPFARKMNLLRWQFEQTAVAIGQQVIPAFRRLAQAMQAVTEKVPAGTRPADGEQP